MPTMTFRELVQTHYIAKGVCLFDAKLQIRGQSGVSMSALRNAYDGTRVSPETAAALVVWANEHHRAQLVPHELTSAPKRERAKVDWGERVETAVKSLAEAIGLQRDETLSVEYAPGGKHEWTVMAGPRTGFGGSGTVPAFVGAFSKELEPENDNGGRAEGDLDIADVAGR